MNKKIVRLGELVCVLLLIGFIAWASGQDKVSQAPFADVAKNVIQSCDLAGLKKRSRLEVKAKYGIDAAGYNAAVCFNSDSVMDVRELIIISGDKQALESAEEKISDYVKEKGTLFEGYAPRESELIASHLLTVKKGYLIFYIGQEKEKVADTFSESL